MLDTLFTILDGIFSSSLFLTIWHWGIPIIIAISCLLAGMISKNTISHNGIIDISADTIAIVGMGVLIAFFWPGIILGACLFLPFWLIYQVGTLISLMMGK